MDNGLEVVAVESPKVPLVTIVLVAKAGAMTETPDITGLTHLWEHMFFKGNKRIPNQEGFNRRIRQLGIVYNGDTSAEKVRYYFTMPSAFLDEGLQFMADAISTPLLEQTELEKERRVVLDEYDRSAAQPSFDFMNLQRIMIYGNQAYQRDPLGLRPVIIGATREQLFRIKDQVFVPSNCALIVGGDVKAEKLLPLVKKHFSGWKDPQNWRRPAGPAFPPFPKTQSFVMARANVQNAQISIAFEGPKARQQAADSYAADVLANLLAHRSGKFYKKFVDSGLSFDADFGYYTQSQAGQIVLGAATKPEDAKRVQQLLLDETQAWTKPGYFTKAQLEDVRLQLLIDHKHELNQPSEFTKTLAFWWAVTGLDYYAGYIDAMRKVDLQDVAAFVKKWLVNRPYVAGILVSPQDASKAGLVDDSKPLVETYLAAYKTAKGTRQ
jgi:zinc protease